MEGFMRLARRTPYIVLATLLFASVSAHAAVSHAAKRAAEDFTGVLVDPAGSGTIPIVLHVDSFTPPHEVESLAATIGDRGPSAAVAALSGVKSRGWIRVGQVLGFEVPIIRSFTTPKGQKIVAVLDQPIEIWDQLQGTRSPDYPFGMVELNVDDNGNGSGRLIAAMRTMFTNDGKIEMVSYGTKPYHIIGVTEQAPRT
jgi:hypothetical protein